MEGYYCMTYRLERTCPESVGIMSASILNCIDTAEAKNLELHSLLIVRHGKLAAELYWKPYSDSSQNHVYSFSKSLVSAAVGFAVDEGLLSYGDRLCDFFPRHIEASADERIFSVTIEHLLTMTSGAFIVNEATVTLMQDWAAYFLNKPLSSFPGEKFNYNSVNTYMLSAVLRKITGMGLVEYLTPRLFEPLGIEGAYWDKCPMGRDCGGWGLHIKSEDMAKFGQLLLDGGKLNGKQLLPADWVARATMAHCDNTTDKKYDGHPDVITGYGYHFWVNRDSKSFRADGMLGQYAVVLPELDCVIVTTGGHMEQLEILDLLWEHLIPEIGMIPDASVPGQDYKELQERADRLSIAELMPSVIPEEAREYSGIKYVFPHNRQSLFPFMSRYSHLKEISGVDDMSFDLQHDYSLTWTECGCTNTIALGFFGEYTLCEVSFFGANIPIAVYPRWLENEACPTLEVLLCPLDIPHSSRLTISFSPGQITVTFNELPSFEDSVRFFGDMFSFMRSLSPKLSKIAGRIAEATIIGTAE